MEMEVRKQQFLKKTEEFVQKIFQHEGTGHDWWHIYRVRNLALRIAADEGGNLFIIEMAALLHDADDWKLSNTPENNRAGNWLNELLDSPKEIQEILHIINQVSFKGAGVDTTPSTLEAKIVQDADRLDAIGAIGIARAFAYGGSRHRLLYHPEIKPEFHLNFQSYKNGESPTINHFYEKLLLLKDRFNTAAAKKIALERHRFMEVFLEHFFNEWENYI